MAHVGLHALGSRADRLGLGPALAAQIPAGPPAGPAELARFGEVLLAIVSIYATLLDDEAVTSPEGDEATGNWAQWLA